MTWLIKHWYLVVIAGLVCYVVVDIMTGRISSIKIQIKMKKRGEK